MFENDLNNLLLFSEETLNEYELDLEFKYEVFYVLDNYFSPIYTKIKNIIYK